MRKILYMTTTAMYITLLGLVVSTVIPSSATAQLMTSKKEFDKVSLTANSTTTFRTDGYTHAQVTITVDAGSPDGTLSVVTRPSTTGGAVTVVTGYTPAGTKTFTGEAQNVLEVVLATHTTGTIGVKVVLW